MSTPTGHGVDDDGWTLLVPVKPLDLAKSRLAPAVGRLGRRSLVLAMADDVLTTCLATPGVSDVRVVTSDPEVLALAGRLGLRTVPDPAQASADRDESGSDPLNRTLAAAMADLPGWVGVVTADLPELRPGTLGRILHAAARHRHSVVPDHLAAGTTMAFWTAAASDRVPRFGADSAERFRNQGGAVSLAGIDPSGISRRDVDTPEDLSALPGRSLTGATAQALRRHTGPDAAPAGGLSATMVP